MKGLSCNIIETKNMQNCSNHGISQTCDSVILLNSDGPFEPSLDEPAVVLVRRQLSSGLYVHAVPVEKPEGKVGPMFGGCFIYTSDSRFPAQYPIPLHDRWETPDEYRQLSI